MRDLLLIFTRNPELGKVKTRLAADVGQETALRLYETLLHHTRSVTEQLRVDRQVLFSEVLEKDGIWRSSRFQKGLQRGNDLGDRMANAFADGFSRGYEKVVIIGTDLYGLQQKDLEDAFDTLDESEVVIGPAEDGGYYLLGMRSMRRELFSQKDWGTSRVLDQTLKDLIGIPISLLRRQNDIDVLEDLTGLPDLEKLITPTGK